MKLLPILTFTATVFFSSTSVLASSMTFDLLSITSDEAYADSITMNQTPIDLVITAWGTDTTNPAETDWTQITGDNLGIDIDSSYGLGVKSSSYDSNELDAWGLDESLLFSFTPTITLESITFYSNDSGIFSTFFLWDDFNLNVDGNLVLDDENILQFGWTGSPLTVAIGLTGDDFRIWADHWSDDFRVASIDVTTTPNIATTPLPAGLWLFGTALFMVGLIKRSKKTA